MSGLPFVSNRPRVLDLFCGAGGAGEGYRLAGYEVVGVDIVPQPRYPFPFFRGEALEYLAAFGRAFDLIHASPPCQAFSKAQRIRDNDHPDLIAPTRDLLLELGTPYVIENVPGAPLREPVELCGAMFGLRVYRHRLFESSLPVLVPRHPEHVAKQVKMGRQPTADEFHQPVGNFTDAAGARLAMGVPWMTRDEIAEAIPPAYCEFIGRQLFERVAGTTVEAAA